MLTPYELLKDKRFYNSKKIENNKTLHFYAFTGYHPVIKMLKEQYCYSFMGAFKWMYVEAKKPKFFTIIRDSDGTIISVCFIIYDSWIVGNKSKGNNVLGTIGYFTQDNFRNKGYCKKVTEYMRDNIKDIMPFYENYELSVQDRVCDFTQNIFGIKAHPFSCTDNSGYFLCYSSKPKHLYSIPFERMHNAYRKRNDI